MKKVPTQKKIDKKDSKPEVIRLKDNQQASVSRMLTAVHQSNSMLQQYLTGIADEKELGEDYQFDPDRMMFIIKN